MAAESMSTSISDTIFHAPSSILVLLSGSIDRPTTLETNTIDLLRRCLLEQANHPKPCATEQFCCTSAWLSGNRDLRLLRNAMSYLELRGRSNAADMRS